MVNDSPFNGKEGEFCTSRQIKERLFKELETDVALRVEELDPTHWTVSGRGELHLAILIERLRREGFEFAVSRPQVIVRQVEGKTLVPYEKAFIEVPEQYQGVIMEKLGGRKGELKDMRTHHGTPFF